METINMEDYNVPSPERATLLNRLQIAIDAVPSPYFWAACQICDIKALEKLVREGCEKPALMFLSARQTEEVATYWTQSIRGQSHNTTAQNSPASNTTPDQAPSSPADSPLAKRQKTTHPPRSVPGLLKRDPKKAALAKERDGNCCILTGCASVDAAHIYPFCRLQGFEPDRSGARRVFWEQLGLFWPVEKIEKWKAELFQGDLTGQGREICENIVTLSKTAHDFWNRGAFALKPISVSEDKTILKVQFFWQKKYSNAEGIASLLTTPPSTYGLDHTEGAFPYGKVELFHNRECIKSGDYFEFKTDDTDKRPLPSFGILELQWFLTRVVGMAGADEPFEEDFADDSDREIPPFDLNNDLETSSEIGQPESPAIPRNLNLQPQDSAKLPMEESLVDKDGGDMTTQV